MFTRYCNCAANLLRKQKQNQYNRLNLKKVTDNMQFSRTMKPLTSNKIKDNCRIMLVKNNQHVHEDI